MERESNPMEALCRSGCGFYGNPATDGLCSVCFKEALKKKQQPPASTPSPVSAAPFVPAPAPAPTPAPAPVVSAPTPLAAAAPTVVCLPHADKCADDEDDSGEGGAGSSSAADTDPDDKDPSKDKKKKNRCAVCRKKVGLTGFECRCGGLFCAVHRYSDKHDCSFDYRELGAQEIRRNNPVVVSQKIHKI